MLELNHIVGEKISRSAGIGTPPAIETAGPADSTHPAAARRSRPFGIEYHGDTQTKPVTGVNH
ncbi:MAG: hypothetical protein R2844_02025 [Caldilineales bacterium]